MDLAIEVSTRPEDRSTRDDTDWPDALDAALDTCFSQLKERIVEVPPVPPLLTSSSARRPVFLLGPGGQPLQRWMAHPILLRLSGALENRSWLAVIASMVAVYIATNFVLPGTTSSASLNAYLVQALVWLYLAVPAVLCWKYGLSRRPVPSKPLIRMAALVGTFQVAVAVIAGVLSSFRDSPYSHRLLALAGSLVHVGMMVLGVETSRACLVVALGRRRRGLGLAVSTVLLALFSVPAKAFRLPLESQHGAFRFLGQVLLPALSQNLLASYLALIGGPLASATYGVIVHGFAWLSPVLPDLQWIASAAVGTLAPMAGLRAILRQPIVTGQE